MGHAAPREAETLAGEVERVTYESEETGFRVLRVTDVPVRGRVTVVGVFPPVAAGARVRVTGRFVEDERHGEQFRADSLVELVPDTLAGLERYLGSGLVPGVGPGFAKRIVAALGMDTLDVLDRHPERLTAIPGLGRARIGALMKHWKEHRAASNVMMLLQSHGASARLAQRIVAQYGERAPKVVQQTPYRLALEVSGVGFRTADRLAQSLGLAGDHPERVQAGLLHDLGTLAEQGHVYCPRGLLIERVGALLQRDEATVEPPHVEAAIDALAASERVVVEEDRVFGARLHAAEVSVSEAVRARLASPPPPLPRYAAAIRRFEAAGGLELASQQRAAVEAAATHPMLVITGGPGVGKTTIVRAIVAGFSAAGVTVALAAPTGRAARRLGEATGQAAHTLHRLLEFDPRARSFGRNREEPLTAGVVIVDEASMLDLPLAAALFDALGRETRLVLVGDADQLPSVGPGAVLSDLIRSRAVPTVRLDEVFRQAAESGIVVNAHRILHGERPVGATTPDGDFFVLDGGEPEEAGKMIETLITRRIPQRFRVDPRRDVQLLTPMHRGVCGTQALNQRLQSLLNPEGPALERGSQRFRAGDKVMQTRNDYGREVFNGDVGSVVAVDPLARTARVRFDDRDVDYDDRALESLTLAYATSIHKSQGSEYPVVVVALLTSHYVMLTRSLLYTAVTRAKRACVVVTTPRALGVALSELRAGERSTSLAERLAAST